MSGLSAPRNTPLRPALALCVWLSDMASRGPGPPDLLLPREGRGLRGESPCPNNPTRHPARSRRRNRSGVQPGGSVNEPKMLSRAAAPSRFPHVAAGIKCSTMPRFDEPIRPMTLGNMRAHGVRGLTSPAGPAAITLRSTWTPDEPRWPQRGWGVAGVPGPTTGRSRGESESASAAGLTKRP
jgi:hypothetical protein